MDIWRIVEKFFLKKEAEDDDVASWRKMRDLMDPPAKIKAATPSGRPSGTQQGKQYLKHIKKQHPQAPKKEFDVVPDEMKPPYKGTFVGQRFRTHGRNKWIKGKFNKIAPGTERLSNLYRGDTEEEERWLNKQEYVDLYWDGKDWVRRDMFLRNTAKKEGLRLESFFLKEESELIQKNPSDISKKKAEKITSDWENHYVELFGFNIEKRFKKQLIDLIANLLDAKISKSSAEELTNNKRLLQRFNTAKAERMSTYDNDEFKVMVVSFLEEFFLNASPVVKYPMNNLFNRLLDSITG